MNHVNRYIMAMAFAVAAASPALAETTTKSYDATGSASPQVSVHGAAARDLVGPEYVGRDPDPRIQSELDGDPADDR
jgi:hypothetical protein